MLLQEEQYIIKWLSQYRTLEIRQIELLLRSESPAFAGRVLNRLCREGYIFKDRTYAGMDPNIKADPKLIDAIWVMLRFSDSVEPMAHYPAQYPAQIFFMKEKTAYEIAVFDAADTHLSRLIQADDDVKFILTLPDASLIREVRLPKAPCLFAVITHRGDGDPLVKFYKGDAQ